jgi:hypothetical protein
MPKQELDFIVVGAQKAGTTSLADYLAQSKQIFVPANKEVPFFLDAEMLKRGLPWFFDTYFAGAEPGALWGTSTPQYMMHPECFAAIRKLMPAVKIMVLLRDPIGRFLSHFDMMRRFGVEKRPINLVIADQLDRVDKLRLTPYPDHLGKYLTSGEYGRIMRDLAAHFGPDGIKVFYFETLVHHPLQILDQACGFLGLAPFTAPDITKVRMKGGARKLIPINHDLLFRSLSRMSRALGMSSLIPCKLKARVDLLSSRLDEWNVDDSTKTQPENIERGLLMQLRRHYEDDARLLEVSGINAPWVAKWQSVFS